ncbi:hypothetical protein [Marinactinospora rubrisoli]|uniref:Uncharacterized protein n=1 Tax=Marinactinospora rubrisoli TaxID=2715399 RepID=A0ABW2KL49_9ACTN
MPRKRPSALRAEPTLRHAVWSSGLLAKIPGLSLRATRQVYRVEALSLDYVLFPGATWLALRRYRAFVAAAGRRPRYPMAADCSCRTCAMDDARHARDVLETVAQRLPPRPRAELRRLLRPLDARYLRCTLPDPALSRRIDPGERWWNRRIAVGTWLSR